MSPSVAQADRGVVVSYDPERGFGFIRSESFHEDVFVHATSIKTGGGLVPGQRVRFQARPDERGPRAVWVEPGAHGRFDLAPGRAASLGLLVALAAGTLGLHFALGTPWLGSWLWMINPAAFLVYAYDKHRAVREARRVPEIVLHTLALAGGSVGALLAMSILRHKSRKNSFRLVTAAIVALQLILIAAWLGTR